MQPETTHKLPSAFNLLMPSWKALEYNILTIVGLYFTPILPAIPLILTIIGAFILNAAYPNGGIPVGFNIAGIVVGLLSVIGIFALFILIGPALIAAELKGAQQQKIFYKEALGYGKKFWPRYLGLKLLMSLIIVCGFILFIVPGIFFIKRYLLAPYFLVDKDMGINAAMNASRQAAKQHSNALWGLMGVMFLIGLTNMVPLIGYIAQTILQIMYFCAPAIRYQQIKAIS